MALTDIGILVIAVDTGSENINCYVKVVLFIESVDLVYNWSCLSSCLYVVCLSTQPRRDAASRGLHSSCIKRCFLI